MLWFRVYFFEEPLYRLPRRCPFVHSPSVPCLLGSDPCGVAPELVQGRGPRSRMGQAFRAPLPLLKVKASVSNAGDPGLIPGLGRSPGERNGSPLQLFLPGESHGRRSLVGYGPGGRKESDTTERLHFRFSLSCIGEGDGNPLWYSCLENPRDRGAWWATVHGVAKSRTRLSDFTSNLELLYKGYAR